MESFRQAFYFSVPFVVLVSFRLRVRQMNSVVSVGRLPLILTRAKYFPYAFKNMEVCALALCSALPEAEMLESFKHVAHDAVRYLSR